MTGLCGNLVTALHRNLLTGVPRNLAAGFLKDLVAGFLRDRVTRFLGDRVAGFLRDRIAGLLWKLSTRLPGNFVTGLLRLADFLLNSRRIPRRSDWKACRKDFTAGF